jgi:hypothetical protein
MDRNRGDSNLSASDLAAMRSRSNSSLATDFTDMEEVRSGGIPITIESIFDSLNEDYGMMVQGFAKDSLEELCSIFVSEREDLIPRVLSFADHLDQESKDKLLFRVCEDRNRESHDTRPIRALFSIGANPEKVFITKIDERDICAIDVAAEERDSILLDCMFDYLNHYKPDEVEDYMEDVAELFPEYAYYPPVMPQGVGTALPEEDEGLLKFSNSISNASSRPILSSAMRVSNNGI